MQKSLSDWLKQLDGSNDGSSFSPSHHFDLVRKAGHRLELDRCMDCPVITVAGTNGKGSCVAALEAIYVTAGYQVGAITSPHLFRFNERICLNRQPVSDQKIIAAFEKIETVSSDLSLNYFQYALLAALLIFRQQPLDIVLVEVGLGGRYDPANILDADIAIITSIALDHCQQLGNSRDDIATEKMAITRSGRPFICGDDHPPQIMSQLLVQYACQYYQYGRDFEVVMDGKRWHWLSAEGDYKDLPTVNILHSNVACALMAVTKLQSLLPIAINSVRSGLQTIDLRGRCQLLSGQPMRLVDVAHNVAAVMVLKQKIQSLSSRGRCFAVFGMLADKEVQTIVDLMSDTIDHWYLATIRHPKSMSGHEIARYFADKRRYGCYECPQQAYQAAINHAQDHDLIIIFGSFYVIAQILSLY